jgi:hypothetical protein
LVDRPYKGWLSGAVDGGREVVDVNGRFAEDPLPEPFAPPLVTLLDCELSEREAPWAWFRRLDEIAW